MGGASCAHDQPTLYSAKSARAREQKKLALIKQIQRVSEEIDRLEGQLRTLDSLANMSRITVELVPLCLEV